jgi:hypothetical protein
MKETLTMRTQPDSHTLQAPQTPRRIHHWIGLSLLLISVLACEPLSLLGRSPISLNPTSLPTEAATSASGLSKLVPKPTDSSQSEDSSLSAPQASVLITDVQGGVQLRTSPAAPLTPAVLGQTIPIGTSIQTDASGQATLQFPDGSLMRIASNTTFQVVGVGNTASNPNTAIKLEIGTLFIFVQPGLDQKVFDVQTPAGVASVRGSYMRVDYYPESDTVILTCLETQATCILVDAQDGITLIMTNGKRGIIIFGQPYGQVEGMTAEDLEDFLTAIPQAIQVVPAVFPKGTPTPSVSRTPLPRATPTTACVPTTLPCPTTVP